MLAYDGSEDAAAAIVAAGRMLVGRRAVVVTVWEPVAGWVGYDPVTVVTAQVDRFVAQAAQLDDTVKSLAEETLMRGVQLASDAGFQVEGRLVEGKPWRAICSIAEELAADPLVIGARGLGWMGSILRGSVSTAVMLHAHRPVLVVSRQSIV